MLNRRMVVQSFAVAMGLAMSLQCGEVDAGKWKFDDTQYESNADYDFELQVFVWNNQTGKNDKVGPRVPYSSNGSTGYPPWTIYTWSVVHEVGTLGQYDMVSGAVYKKDLLSSPVVWVWYTSFDPMWIP